MLFLLFSILFNFSLQHKDQESDDALKYMDSNENNSSDCNLFLEKNNKQLNVSLTASIQNQTQISNESSQNIKTKISNTNIGKDEDIIRENESTESLQISNTINLNTISDYSNGEYNISQTIYINDAFPYSRIENSYISCTGDILDYLFVITKDFTFENVVFVYHETNSSFGAIKIDCGGDVTIRNCIFESNFVQYLYGASAIYFETHSPAQSNSKKIIENCTFLTCGKSDTRGFTIINNDYSEFILLNSTFDNCNGGIKIDSYSSSVLIEKCFFINCKRKSVSEDYTIDVSTKKVTINECNISFVYMPSKDYAAICFNNHGEIELINSTILEARHEGGVIKYNHDNNQEISDSSEFILIEGCEVRDCKGKIVNIIAPSASKEEVVINKNRFISCTTFRQSVIGCGSDANSIGLSITGNIINTSYTINDDYEMILLDIKTNPPEKVSNPIQIIDNIFIYLKHFYSSYNQLAIKITQQDRGAVIHNCSFKNCYRDRKSPWANSIYINKLDTVEVINCTFYKCGDDFSTDNGDNAICILGGANTIGLIQNCTFDETTAAVYTLCESTSFIGNKMINCDRNLFQVKHESGLSGFELIDNQFLNPKQGTFIYLRKELEEEYIKYTPTIRGNTFSCTQYESRYNAFIFNLKDVDSITFENNTFRSINTYNGGFSGQFKSNETIQLTFTNCTFEGHSQSTNGGGFCSPEAHTTSNTSVSLTFNKCCFNNNAAQGNGGALYIHTSNDVTIKECEFNNNKATNYGSRKGYGGAIYISEIGENLIIKDCKFSGNSAVEGQAIYCSMNLNHLNIAKTNFSDNFNKGGSSIDSPQFIIVLETDSLNISEVNFENPESTSKNTMSYPILFKNATSIQDLLFYKDTCQHSALLYIPDKQSEEEMILNNLTFIECECKDYVIDIFKKKVKVNECSISFSIPLYKECGGIRINNHGEIEVTNNAISNAKSSTGTIFYKHNDQIKSEISEFIFIQKCEFNKCIGKCIQIEAISGSQESVSIDDNRFLGCYNENEREPSCIGLGPNTDSIALLIRGNLFEKCQKVNNEDNLIFINIESSLSSKVYAPIEIADNVFNFEPTSTFWYSKHGIKASQLNRDIIIIHNCSFTNCLKINEVPWSNSICLNGFDKVEIHDCKFYKCGYCNGNLNEGGNVIGILGGYDTLSTIQNCEFDSSSSTISSYSESTKIIYNIIQSCGRSAIRITSQKGKEGLEIFGNHFLNLSYGCVFNIWDSDYYGGTFSIKYEPLIMDNLFKHINTKEEHFDYESAYAFIFDLNQMKSIVFINNVFHDIQTSVGGFGSRIFVRSGSANLTFVDCVFENNSQNTNGGCFCSTDACNEGKIYLNFIKCAFINNEAHGNGGSLFINSEEDVNIDKCEFIDNEAIFENENKGGIGGCIYISKVGGQLSINKCKFGSNSANEGQAIYCANSSTRIQLTETTFENNITLKYNENALTPQFIVVLQTTYLEISKVSFVLPLKYDIVEYPILFKSCSYVSDITFDCVNSSFRPLIYIPSSYSVTFENISFVNCYSTQFIIQTDGNFNLYNSKIHFDDHFDVKAISVLNGKTQIHNSMFYKCGPALDVSTLCQEFKVDESFFIDCYTSQQTIAVISIHNHKSTISYNIINFTSNSIGLSISSLYVEHHGDILITNNQFIKGLNSFNGNIMLSDRTDDQHDPDLIVIFNFNVIEKAGNTKFGHFYIDKHYNFNLDHNIIRNSTIDDYSCSLDLSQNVVFSREFMITNLTLSNCESGSQSGGGLGLWTMFSRIDGIKRGKITLTNCLFENNKSGYGGAYEPGFTSSCYTETIVINCTFRGNQAYESGGALSLQISSPAYISNCYFVNNVANKGGGAIYIKPFKLSQYADLMPNCSISQCVFESNKDATSSNGHSIYFNYLDGCQTLFTVSDCNFTDDGYLNCNGSVILARAPISIFENIRIEFASNANSQSGIEIDSHSNVTIVNNCEFVNNIGLDVGAIKASDINGSLSIIGCNFVNCAKDEVPSLILSSSNPIIFEFNTIQNCTYSRNIGIIEIKGDIKNIEQVISSCNFSKNYQVESPINSEASGLLIQHSNSLLFSVTYKSCIFNDNHASSRCKVGAILAFDECIFASNEGGAISIETEYDVNVQSCVFYKNNAKYGSSICIYPDKQERIRICACRFDSNGNSIHIDKGDSTTLDILDCNFTDKRVNGEASSLGFVIVSGCESTNVSNILVVESSAVKIDGAIRIFGSSAVSVNKLVIEGKMKSAIKLDNELNSKITWRLSITESQFNSNSNDNDFAVALLSDTSVAEISEFVLQSNEFNRGSLLSLNVSSSFTSVDNIIILKCISKNGQILDIHHSNDIIISNSLIDGCKADRLFSIISKVSINRHLVSLLNTSFTNNECNGLYGGGSGLFIESNKILFKKCRFNRNLAIPKFNEDDGKRPQPDGIKESYYNGDGGGIQLGYSSALLDIDLEFDECNFSNNFAYRHGGALAIQTLKTVKILGCVFEENSADNKQLSSSSSISELLYENHFNKKREGRGGAIYINPTFSYHLNDQSYPMNDQHMTSIDISNCIFTSNKAFDGFSIYIEGDEPKDDFSVNIINNTFVDNFQINGDNDVNSSFRSIIASEVNLKIDEIESNNAFVSENTTNVTLVDHFGNAIQSLPTETIDSSSMQSSDFEETESSEIITNQINVTLEETESLSELYENTESSNKLFESTEPLSESYESTESSNKLFESTEPLSESYESTESSNKLFESTESLSESNEETITKSNEEFKETSTSIVSKSFDAPESFTLSHFYSSSSSILQIDDLGTTDKKKGGMNIGVIIGIVCGIVFAVLIPVLIFFFVYRRKKNLEKSLRANNLDANYSIAETKTSKKMPEQSLDQEEDDEDLDFWL